jgi:hypothetical protein
MYLIVDEYVGFQNTFIAAVRVLHEQKILAKITIEQKLRYAFGDVRVAVGNAPHYDTHISVKRIYNGYPYNSSATLECPSFSTVWTSLSRSNNTRLTARLEHYYIIYKTI